MKGPTILLSFVQSLWWRNSTDFILHTILREIIIRWKKDTSTYCKCREGLGQPVTLSNIEYFCLLITRETAIIVSAISLLQLLSKCYTHLLCYISTSCINVFQIKTHEKGRCRPIQTLFQHKSFALIFARRCFKPTQVLHILVELSLYDDLVNAFTYELEDKVLVRMTI